MTREGWYGSGGSPERSTEEESHRKEYGMDLRVRERKGRKNGVTKRGVTNITVKLQDKINK